MTQLAEHKTALAAPPGIEAGIELRKVQDTWNRTRALPFWARESIRKTLHIGVVIFAIPLHWFGFWYGMLFAGAAMAWNWVGMPRYFDFTFRDEEKQAGYSRGMLSYPVVVFILMLLFPLPIAVSQWATLSFGDGFATLIGRFYGKHPLPWNKEKTFEGYLAFFVMGMSGAVVFFWLTMGNAAGSSWVWQGSHVITNILAFNLPEVILVCAVSTIAAGFFESLPLKYVDDNVAAPLAGALVKLALCYLL